MNNDPVQLKLLEKTFSCTVCEHQHFISKHSTITTKSDSFIGLGQTKEPVHCMICTRCGYIHWFMPGVAARSAQKDKS